MCGGSRGFQRQSAADKSLVFGEPVGIRTRDLLIKSQLLYRLSYRLSFATPRSICVLKLRLGYGHPAAHTRGECAPGSAFCQASRCRMISLHIASRIIGRSAKHGQCDRSRFGVKRPIGDGADGDQDGGPILRCLRFRGEPRTRSRSAGRVQSGSILARVRPR
jgi:hypothetical protein